MLKRLQNNPAVTLFLVVVIILGFNIGILPVSIMEARNFITAREMVTDGNWLLTTMNGLPRYEKPPLPTWLSAIFGLVFGINKVMVMRLPAVLFVAITGTGIYFLSKKVLDNQQQSIINALIGLTSFYVIGIIIEAPWDIFTHGFMLIAIYFLFQFFQGEQYIRNSILAGVFIGFSILSKGPISVYALLLPFLIAYGLTYKYKFSKKAWVGVINCLIIALVIGGWWYLYVRLNDSHAFKAIAEKETSNWGSYNVKPFYYYWSFFTQSGIWTIPALIGLLYPYLKSRVSNLKAYKFSLLWTILSVILLSIVPEKKARYLMPVLIPLAINTGFYIDYLFRTFRNLNDKRETLPVYFNFGLIALIGILFPFSAFFINHSLDGINVLWFILASIALLTVGIFMLIHLRRKNIKWVFYMSITFVASVLLTVLPLFKIQNLGDYLTISNLKEESSQQHLKVYSLDYIAPEIIWQFGDKIPSLKDENDKIIFPTESKFGLMVNELDQEEHINLQTNYSMEKKTTYDLNTASPSSKKYNNRLKSDFYIVTKK